MASSRIPIRGYRAGFFFVVVLLSAVTAFTLWTEVRTGSQVDGLVQEALERAGSIGRIRVDALSLEAAIEAHVRATGDAERRAADAVMEQILADIRASSEAYTRNLPQGEKALWYRFNAACQGLADQVRAAAIFSQRREAERARRHLAERIRPLAAELDALGGALEEENAAEARRLVNRLEDLRVRNTALGAGATLLAILLSSLVGWRVTSLLKRQEAIIQGQLEELGRHNQELDAFTRRVAHDLISPLAPLKGYLTLIRRTGAVNDAGALEMLAQCESSAVRMGELIEALLRFCRAGTRGESTVGELDTAVTTVLLEVAQTAAAQGVALERELEPGVAVDCPGQLLQVSARNLLTNAVKYSEGRPDPRVKVRVATEDGMAVLEVVDNGIGMAPGTLASLFQPFFRAPEVRGLPGHGLGLVTTKRVVEAHGGTLVVRSEEGKGTHVVVRFPRVVRPAAATSGSQATTASAGMRKVGT
ncbi:MULTISPECIES: sensor histidine kinase [Myxococcus]|uniref:histidine kinase n=1 Tax=Myxococcus xanthus TaxID=34 RepID=A0AAE6KQZ5_MYXXA|nr:MULTISPECIES: HAMP domain-containing sensor histidine kinase [Myxococcus]QDE66594.1 two-component sensor histidine kinase [Myxococcus xanthus]QDE73867.1 two-component sensor histidine kinase [Myxococcus xanthus]QDE81128.1 two-component sensor histidine kinase [Myxococcus xanthus]QDE95460.1 two-component sensor histidine kinase [Myxococcus xanthus]QDF02750.1 two-component sensor histidine kinase [Myxococcus xanthus]